MNEPNKIKLIAIEGLIKRANTALTQSLGKTLGAYLICDADQVSPLLNISFSGPEDFQLKKHLLRLVDRYKAQRRLRQMDIFQDTIISDYLFYADRIHATVNLAADDLPLYEQVVEFMEKEITIPDLVIYLQYSPEGVILSLNEEKKKPSDLKINTAYIESLCNEFNEFFMWYRWSPVLIVNANRFSPDQPEHLEDLLEKIQKPFTGIIYYNPPESI